MAMNLRPAALVALAIATALPEGLDSCGIGPPAPVFGTVRRPADLRAAFLGGRVGVIRPSYDRNALFAAYRVLTGAPLTQEELDELYALQAADSPNPYLITGAWERERQRIAGNVPAVHVDVYKTIQSPGVSYYFRNCLDDAFFRAQRTLEDRAAAWGADSPRLRDWLAAQDQVFSNCSAKDPVIPAPPPQDADPLFAADRNYQIAAAYFYAGKWAEARATLAEITKDQKSPWRNLAPYLIARCWIREGTLDGNQAAFPAAEQQLQAVLNDPAQSEWRESSQHLLDLVHIWANPYSRSAELAISILRPGAEQPGAKINDFLYLYRRLSDSPDSLPRLASSSDLADWLLAFQGTYSPTNHAYERWRETRSPAWLIPALQTADGDQLPELLQAAHRINQNAPEFDSAVYYGIIREMRRGNKEAARAWADQVLAKRLLVSTRNLLLAERLKLARNWTEFLRAAPRRPEPAVEFFDGEEIPAKSPSPNAPLFDLDSTRIVNGCTPLSLWVEGANSPVLPASLQLQMAQAGWLRAIILQRLPEARRLMERIVQLQPTAAQPAKDFLAATNPDEAAFAALYLHLRSSAVNPMLIPSSDRVGNLGAVKRSPSAYWGVWEKCDSTAGQSIDGGPVPSLDFLSPAQRKQAEAEIALLQKAAPSGSTYLASRIVSWANSHSDDPRVPEALHLAVQATRYGLKDAQTGDFSRQAFQLLHQKYPKSEWTAKTPYWYK